MSGDVVPIEAARMRRMLRQHAASRHPALRWTIAGGNLAHRRSTDSGATRCGLRGPLVPAETAAPKCRACYPVSPS